jgi:hypothetical protein
MASTRGQTKAAPAGARWTEYKIFLVPGYVTPHYQAETEGILNALAADGWEFVWGDDELRVVMMGRVREGVPVDAVPAPRSA